MNLPDIRALEWSEEIFTAAGTDRSKLPDIVESMEVVASIFLPAPCRAGRLVQWLKNTFCDSEISAAEQANIDVYDLLNIKAGETPPGSGGIIFLPTKKSSIKALYGRAFKAPNVVYLYGIEDVVTGNKDIEPETINVYEIIYLYKAKDLKALPGIGPATVKVLRGK